MLRTKEITFRIPNKELYKYETTKTKFKKFGLKAEQFVNQHPIATTTIVVGSTQAVGYALLSLHVNVLNPMRSKK